jgi:hypothetical protein
MFGCEKLFVSKNGKIAETPVILIFSGSNIKTRASKINLRSLEAIYFDL